MSLGASERSGRVAKKFLVCFSKRCVASTEQTGVSMQSTDRRRSILLTHAVSAVLCSAFVSGFPAAAFAQQASAEAHEESTEKVADTEKQKQDVAELTD